MPGGQRHAALPGVLGVSRSERPASPASVRARLLNIARARGEEFEYVLTRYANERLLYRLSKSRFRDQFVLKGAMLFNIWGGTPPRPSRDLDLLGFGDPAIPHLVSLFREVCDLTVEPDGITFLGDSLDGTPIRDDDEYEGVRLRLLGDLAGARISVQVDVGFGDAVTPEALEETYPAMLDQSPPILKVYPKESFIAEKLEAIVSLGIANSRMKDFYDLNVLSETFAFDGSTLCEAIRATFERRRTPLSAQPPTALTATFFNDAQKRRQWSAFTSKLQVPSPLTLGDVTSSVSHFLLPLLGAASTGATFDASWSPDSGWSRPGATSRSDRPAQEAEEEITVKDATPLRYKYVVEQVSAIGDEHRGMIWALNRRAEDGWRLVSAYKDAADRHVLIFEKPVFDP
jgi:predicted nucleotidyltransferase component of viral defense system